MRFTTIEPLPYGRICFFYCFQANPTKLKGMGGHTFGSSCIISIYFFSSSSLYRLLAPPIRGNQFTIFTNATIRSHSIRLAECWEV